jgi:hypothetical protein
MFDKEFLDNFLSNYPNLTDGKTIKFDTYSLIMRNATAWHGKSYAKFLASCFLSSGGPTMPGYENSASTFTFDYPEFDE